LSKERFDIKKAIANSVCPEGSSSKDSCSIEFQIIATKEQEDEKDVDTRDTLAPTNPTECK
jgi:hypothetical protein